MKSTTDIWFASYLLLKDHKCDSFNVVTRHKGEYKFNIDNEEWKRLKLEYIDTEIKRVEELQKQLKDLLY